MSERKPHLEQIQRWMQSVIMHRGGVAEAVEAPETRQHLDVPLADLESVIRRSRRLSAENRLEIYVNAYYARLLECLDEEFAVTRYALGDELFAAVAFGYLQSYPSRSYTLGQLGSNFPRYLAESRLHAREMPGDAAASWPEFVIEVAAFERVVYEVYDGAGTERSGAWDSSELAQTASSAWDRLRLIVAPSLRLERFEHPVHAFWAARKDGGEPRACEPRTTRLVVWRRDFVVEHRALAEAEFALLDQIARGATLEAAIAEAHGAPGPAPGEAELGAWFARFAQEGCFVGVEFSE